MATPALAKILAILNERTMGPAQYADEFDIPTRTAYRHFKKLEELGYLEVIDAATTGRRGPHERIFRGTQIVLFDTAMWERLPELIRRGYSGVIWETYGRRVNQALKTGTFDADTNRHFSWKPLKLDEQGWKTLVTGLDNFLDWVMDVEVEAATRMWESGEEPMNATVGLAGFRSPKSAQDGPPVR
jgi:hypothetical protein